MQYKKLGRTGLKVSPLGIGALLFGADVNETDSIKIMDMAFDKGINLFDTGNGYADGRSEEIVGKAIKNKRHQVVLATKCGQTGTRCQRSWSFSQAYITGCRG